MHSLWEVLNEHFKGCCCKICFCSGFKLKLCLSCIRFIHKIVWSAAAVLEQVKGRFKRDCLLGCTLLASKVTWFFITGGLVKLSMWPISACMWHLMHDTNFPNCQSVTAVSIFTHHLQHQWACSILLLSLLLLLLASVVHCEWFCVGDECCSQWWHPAAASSHICSQQSLRRCRPGRHWHY